MMLLRAAPLAGRRGAQRRPRWLVAAGAVLGLAFDVKLFEALSRCRRSRSRCWRSSPSRAGAAALAGGLAAFVTVGVSWIAVASLTPLGARPWPIGSTNGSIWNAVFVFDGIDRLTGHASAAALAQDPPGLTRLFGGTDTPPRWARSCWPRSYSAAAPSRLAGRPAASSSRARCVSALAGRRGRAAEPHAAHAAALPGSGHARRGRRGRRRAGRARPRRTHTPRRRAAAAAVAAAAVGAVLLARPPAWAAAAALAGAAACALAAAVRARVTALVALGLVAILAVPAAAARDVARAHRSDAGAPLSIGPADLAALSRFLVAHQGGARYEAASTSAFRAAPLIIHDARPVLSLTSVYGRPLLGARDLRRAVAAGQVRYILGREAGTVRPSWRWASAHSHDVSHAAGLPAGNRASTGCG